ncbi:hypothetical protein [Actinomycetospora straminea]|uniref:Uncharacterized protein n=1 Tax=Actinomycetospora straminea TaxID=663607 RepID=A0ABP9FFN9_9PSEU|nr:hypothetical protein [Actinomycetospora straminea]MDD7934795.1 hypothetical protein [Actinomycetospora straminea]
MTAADQAETRAQQRAREAAERAEWDRLSKIYFAHMNAVAPDQFHCFCGSLDDLRHAVARLDHEATRNPGAKAGRSSGRAASSATSRGALRAAGHVDQDEQRREQLTQWHAADRTVERGSVDVDAG